MRKRIVSSQAHDPLQGAENWLDLARLATVEVTSEDATCPAENALLPDSSGGWRAAERGPQTLRLIFDAPQAIRRVRLRFAETVHSRTQEFVLRYTAPEQPAPRDIVRQQWTFSPSGSTTELEDYRVNLEHVSALELTITPDIAGGDAPASLAELRLA